MEEALRPIKILAMAARERFKIAKAEHNKKFATSKARSKSAEKEAAKILATDQSVDVGYLFEPDIVDEPMLLR